MKWKRAASAPLSAAQLLAHPEYPYVIWDLKPDRKEKVAVAKGRGGPFNIAYEVAMFSSVDIVKLFAYAPVFSYTAMAPSRSWYGTFLL